MSTAAPLIGYVSDERFLALPDVSVELANTHGRWCTRTSPTGGIHLEVPVGRYRVTLAKDGYGAKHANEVDIEPGALHQFRLLSDQITGYIWPKWAQAGDLGEFRVHSPEPYRLSLRRHGAEVEETALIGWFDEHAPRATVQVTPDGDYTQTGVHFNEAGYVDPNHKQYVAAPERSGLYFFVAEGESGTRFTFPWVVAPREPTAPIAVLASTNTWNAYNNFGGRSNYINAAGLPAEPVLVARMEMARYTESKFSEHAAPNGSYPPLSFERPEPLNQIPADAQAQDPIRGRQPSHLAAGEWRLLSWLERQGYHHDLYSDAQLHDGTLDLDQYTVLILNTHPEYWSAQMYDRVHAWVHDRGGKLLYLGGNGADCEVAFTDSGALEFKTHVTDDGCESRMHRSHRPTSELLGVVFTDAGAMTAAPLTVLDPAHWILGGTGHEAGATFGAQSLHERCPGGASGHETDKVGRYAPNSIHTIARGTNRDDGGAQVSYFDTASGGSVFAAASITWTTAILVDDTVSRITANVIDRFLT